MIPALIAGMLLSQATVEIARGEEIRPGFVYWGTEDTTLDASAPDEPFGNSLTLLGGPGKAILIQFKDLDRAVGPGRRVKEAKLVLTPVSSKPELQSIARIMNPWYEGPMRPLLARVPSGRINWAATWKSRRSGEAASAWQSPGASGSADAGPVDGANPTSTDELYEIAGLGEAVERMRQRWYENHGFVLRFAKPAEFYSSQAQIGRPRLVLTLEDAPAVPGPDLAVRLIEAQGSDNRTYVAHVRNLGDQPSKAFTATWFVGEKAGSSVDHVESLAPGAETTVTIQKPFKPIDTDHRLQPIGLLVRQVEGDSDSSNDFLEIQESAFPIAVAVPQNAEAWVQRVVRTWNEVVSPQSRYSFAPSGSLERIRVAVFGSGGIEVPADEVGNDTALLRKIAAALNLPDLAREEVAAGSGQVALTIGSSDLHPGMLGGGDTRYEGAVPGTMWLPYEPRAFEPFQAIPPEATGLLSATAIASLNANLGKLDSRVRYVGFPKSVLVKATDLSGTVLAEAEIDFFQSNDGRIDLGSPVFTINTNQQGIAVLPSREGGLFGSADPPAGQGVLLARMQRNEATGWAWLKAWQLADAFARGNAAVVIADLRFNVPGAPINSAVNLAANKIVSESTQAGAAKLSALVDEKLETAVDLPSGKDSWVEIDLGRDRSIGEIRLLGSPDGMWRQFDILAYGTGQLPATVQPIFRERDWLHTANNRSESLEAVREVAYRTTGTRYRYIRLVNRSGEAGRLNEILVAPTKTEQ